MKHNLKKNQLKKDLKSTLVNLSNPDHKIGITPWKKIWNQIFNQSNVEG
jgi:hypothetical protein